MTAKLIVSVKEVNGIAQVIYYCKERRRIYRKSFADTVREFRGRKGGCTPTCRANTVTNMKTKLLNVSSLNVIELDILKLDTHVRLKELNYYSTHTSLIKYFKLEHLCDKTSKLLQDLGMFYRLERIHKKWQVTEYIIKGAALIDEHVIESMTINSNKTRENKLVYYIKSVDDKSHLLVDADTVEPIGEYHSQWSID